MKVFLILIPILFSLDVFAELQLAKDMKWLSTPAIIKINEDYCRQFNDPPLYICVGRAKGSNIEDGPLSCRTESSSTCPDAQACYYQRISGEDKEKYSMVSDVKIESAVSAKPKSSTSSGGSK